tara:strand:+ start:436 stop:840 length:405 start_codon:yes stop_codon:yes gene_type:complete
MDDVLIFNDNMTNNRPLSPHLQIYKPQLTSVLSISHRITGVILSLLSLLVPLSLLIISLGEDYFNLLIVILDHFLVKLILVGSLFTLIYHLSNGIRHIFWDMGYGLDIKDSYWSGYLVVFISILVTFLITLAIL